MRLAASPLVGLAFARATRGFAARRTRALRRSYGGRPCRPAFLRRSLACDRDTEVTRGRTAESLRERGEAERLQRVSEAASLTSREARVLLKLRRRRSLRSRRRKVVEEEQRVEHHSVLAEGLPAIDWVVGEQDDPALTDRCVDHGRTVAQLIGVAHQPAQHAGVAPLEAHEDLRGFRPRGRCRSVWFARSACSARSAWPPGPPGPP